MYKNQETSLIPGVSLNLINMTISYAKAYFFALFLAKNHHVHSTDFEQGRWSSDLQKE